MDATISLTSQNEQQCETYHNKAFLLNSSFKKHPNVDSKETRKEWDDSRRAVSTKGNQIGCPFYHKKKFEYSLGEGHFQKTFNSSPQGGVGKEPNAYDSEYNLRPETGYDAF
ncbi:hypothetical protein TNCT_188051 [Trichonephila clavata]|uniref:Uncharacterized protein n=1 Tax=Trichonephila clavata TaxID=2740835 RepID=A0A8X6H0L6_TRICU|nr:hypothetical protein TNCT_188051 [Trichonephila clavata]